MVVGGEEATPDEGGEAMVNAKIAQFIDTSLTKVLQDARFVAWGNSYLRYYEP